MGCKVNQVESAYIHEHLLMRGYIPSEAEDSADILILNSCAVTEKAYKETKKILRSWIKNHPLAVIITGCSAVIYERELERLAKEGGIPYFLILGQDQKYEIEKYLQFSENASPVAIDTHPFYEGCYPLLLQNFLGHSRAFLKIQDGCSSYCSYCLVPLARGPSRSLPEEHVLTQIRIFLDQGYEEIVLTGIHLGMWGIDHTPKKKLTDLLWKIEELLKAYGKLLNLRLSSLEINEIDEDFLTFAKESNFLCPHFHIPLQSGSNLILKRMNRNYSSEEYLEKLSLLYNISPQATFGADVLVGFPGEGEKEFRETYELIQKSPLNWLHIFPFSPRPQTPAKKMEPKVSPNEQKERAKLLKELHREKRKAFLKRNLNQVRKVVIEEERDNLYRGLTDNYIQINLLKLKTTPLYRGKIVRLRLKELRGEVVLAEFAEN